MGLGGAVLAALVTVVVNPYPGDYHARFGANPDDAGPAIHALAGGHPGGLPDIQPLMGLASILLRLPFAAIGNAIGDLRLEYQLGAFACVWALAVAALAIAGRSRNNSPLARAAGVLLIVANPATIGTLDAGHPEELLLAATATGGVWLAAAGRSTAAGVMIGLAAGTKPFGIFALLPGLLSRPARAARVLWTSVLTAALLILPLPLLAPGAYLDGSRQLARLTRIYAPSVWWPLGHDRPLTFSLGDAGPVHKVVRVMPAGFDRGSGVLLAVLVVVLACGIAWARRRGEPLGMDALALLAVAFAARAACDPQNLEYYLAPAITAVVAWELSTRDRPPLVSTIVVALDWVTFHSGLERAGPQAAVFIPLSLLLIAYLLTAAIRRPRESPSL